MEPPGAKSRDLGGTGQRRVARVLYAPISNPLHQAPAKCKLSRGLIVSRQPPHISMCATASPDRPTTCPQQHRCFGQQSDYYQEGIQPALTKASVPRATPRSPPQPRAVESHAWGEMCCGTTCAQYNMTQPQSSKEEAEGTPLWGAYTRGRLRCAPSLERPYRIPNQPSVWGWRAPSRTQPRRARATAKCVRSHHAIHTTGWAPPWGSAALGQRG